jgi:uncharacterized phage protein (TIGR02218 family)
MREIPISLQDHLNTGATTLCWCWKILRTDGKVLGFTDHDNEISFENTVFEPETGATASELHEEAGMSVDNADLSGVLKSDAITEQDIRLGLYDNAEVYVYRVNWAESAQRILYKKGSIGQVKRSLNYFTAEFRGIPHKAQQQRGRIYQYDCDANLGDSRCGVSLVGLSHAFTVTRIVDSITFVCRFDSFLEGLHNLSDYFSRGLISWTTGANANSKVEIYVHTLSTDPIDEEGDFYIRLWEPIYASVSVSEKGIAQVGCNKAATTCKNKFNNVINFRGFPTIPGTDLMVRYARKGENNTAAPLTDTFGESQTNNEPTGTGGGGEA